jgi:hypothetical protein
MIDQHDLTPVEPLMRLLGEEDANLHVVTVEGLIEPETGETEWVGNLLDLDFDLSDNFRRALLASLRSMADAMPEAYEPGWVPTEGEIAVATREVLEESPLLDAILHTVQRRDRAADTPIDERGEDGEDPPRVAGHAIR